MGANSFGAFFQITTFGESHGPCVGVVLDGIRPGLDFEPEQIQAELDRRRPGTSAVTSPRDEPDRLEILSGVFEGKTTGAPICLIVRNTKAAPEAYEPFKHLLRPGHADHTVLAKYGIRDWRGGGRLSGRETVARVAAGAVARQLLTARGVEVFGFVAEAAGIKADLTELEQALTSSVAKARAISEANPMRCPDATAAASMESAIKNTAEQGDSVGGVCEVRAVGVPAGWGDPVFWKLDAELASALMSIGGVKGVELGGGFALTGMRGSEANDPIAPDGFLTNRAGGVLGGISSGQPVVARVAVKPTSSIAKRQPTVDEQGRPATIRVTGRHDPCLCPRVVPVAEAMTAITLAEAMLRQDALQGRNAGGWELEFAAIAAEHDMLTAAHRLLQLHPQLDSDRAGDRFMDQARQFGMDEDLARKLWTLLTSKK